MLTKMRDDMRYHADDGWVISSNTSTTAFTDNKQEPESLQIAKAISKPVIKTPSSFVANKYDMPKLLDVQRQSHPQTSSSSILTGLGHAEMAHHQSTTFVGSNQLSDHTVPGPVEGIFCSNESPFGWPSDNLNFDFTGLDELTTVSSSNFGGNLPSVGQRHSNHRTSTLPNESTRPNLYQSLQYRYGVETGDPVSFGKAQEQSDALQSTEPLWTGNMRVRPINRWVDT